MRAFVALCDAFVLCFVTLGSATTTIGPTASLASLSAMLPRIVRRIPDRIFDPTNIQDPGSSACNL